MSEENNVNQENGEVVELQEAMKAKVSEILANRKESDEPKKRDLVMVAIPTDLHDDVTE